MKLTHESPYSANNLLQTTACNLLAVTKLHSLKHLHTEYE